MSAWRFRERGAERFGRAACVLGGIALGALLGGCTVAVPAPVEERSTGAVAPGRTAPQTGAYTVRENDTLYSIAWRYGVDYQALARANGIAPPYTIRVGQRIRVVDAAEPAASRPRAEAPKTVAATPPRAAPPPKPVATTSPRPPVPRTVAAKSAATVVAANAKADARASVKTQPAPPRPAASKPPSPASPKPAVRTPRPAAAAWRPPVAARPVRRFGGSSAGHDYELAPATRIEAAAAGVVVYAGRGLGGFRHLVIVKCTERYLVAYGTNAAPEVAEGDSIGIGDKVAEVGAGPAAGEFHFEIRDRGKPIDPARLIGG